MTPPRRFLTVVLLVVALAGACSSGSGKHSSTTKTTVPAATTTSGATPASTSPSTTVPPTPTNFLVQSASFISPTDAWALGSTPCGANSCTAVARTSDRGQHWQRVGAPSVPLGSDAADAVAEVRFADAKNGWAFRPALWATHDGGAHWTKVNVGGAVSALEVSGGTAWAVVQPCFPASSGCTQAGRLEHATVAADTWTAVSGVALPVETAGSTIGLHGAAVYVLTVGNQGGLLAGSATGGFVKRANPCPAAGQGGPLAASGMAVSTDRDVAVLCVGGAAAGSSEKRVVVSSDAGQHFTALSSPPLGGQPIGIAAAAPRTIVVAAASGASELYRTTGGAWATVLQFGDGGAGWNDLGFTDGRRGMVVYGPAVLTVGLGANSPPGLARLYLTEDAGASWHAVPVNV